MPTTRPRHLITETDQVAAALDAAARRWPEHADSRAQLLVKLMLEGYATVQEAERVRREEMKAAIKATSGVVTGMWQPGDIERLREEWPE